MTNKHTATMTNGKTAKRTSQNRTYTHCIQITSIGVDVAIESSKRDIKRLAAEVARYEAVDTDEKAFADSPKWMQESGRAWTAAKYAEFAANTCARLEAEAARLATYEARKAAGHSHVSDYLEVVTWCGSHALAVKQFNSWNGKNGIAATIRTVDVTN